MTAPGGEELVRRMKLALQGIPTIGAIAVATRRTGVCDVGERGVCYEVYARSRRADGDDDPSGYSFLFASGRFDGFSTDEVRAMLTLTGEVCPDVMDYRFRNVVQLCDDFDRGRFTAALSRPARPTGTPS
jgi:hypothetical protein